MSEETQAVARTPTWRELLWGWRWGLLVGAVVLVVLWNIAGPGFQTVVAIAFGLLTTGAVLALGYRVLEWVLLRLLTPLSRR